MPNIDKAIVWILLLLFGAVEADAILDGKAIEMALSGLGIIGSLLLIWLRRER